MVSKIKLFCFHHAGGSSSAYYNWKDYLNKDIEIIPIELAGRGKRLKVPLYTSMEEAVLDIYNLMKPNLDGSPFAMFGHSMGALLIYEMIQKIHDIKGVSPIHAFFSGRLPVHTIDQQKRYTLPDQELKKYIVDLGGIPLELQSYDEILDMFLPIIRADFKLVETYELKKKISPFTFNISILYGYDDKLVDNQDLIEWANYTSKQCHFYGYQGGHFFINDFTEEVIKVINKTLSSSDFQGKIL
ncbi:thioesterase [Bacillus cereus]|uniref:thioesterase II family protein n=1 Tax=Bacillus cereus TaxID=1396 RepID=UPI000BEB600A|nr:thioesterase domain-containing protein [Bacillus cereus]PEC52563.1 thioesterase [Bacillus cereus]PFN14349.1 thioesterase [Bacillus cereus]PFS74708.1 thioesterase [Bacillus cereus]PGY20347.1 thioesterase [Bacillus cereus]